MVLLRRIQAKLSADKQTDLRSPDGYDILLMISICQWLPQVPSPKTEDNLTATLQIQIAFSAAHGLSVGDAIRAIKTIGVVK